MTQHQKTKEEIDRMALAAHTTLAAMPLSPECKEYFHHMVEAGADALKTMNALGHGELRPIAEVAVKRGQHRIHQ